MHPYLIEYLVAERLSELRQEADAVRRAAGFARPPLRMRWDAVLTRVTALVYRPSPAVCCPA